MPATFLDYGDDLPPHEVNYEQSMVAPLLELLLAAYQEAPESFDQAELTRRLPWLTAFAADQPDVRMRQVPIRHWDGYWFGLLRLWGDVFPHYWSVLSAAVYLTWPRELVSATEAEWLTAAGQAILRANLVNFHADGSATCAFVYPSAVNGRPAHVADPLANDQDWALVYAPSLGHHLHRPEQFSESYSLKSISSDSVLDLRTEMPPVRWLTVLGDAVVANLSLGRLPAIEPVRAREVVPRTAPGAVGRRVLRTARAGPAPGDRGRDRRYELVTRHLAYLHRSHGFGDAAADRSVDRDHRSADPGAARARRQQDRLLQGYVAAAELHQRQLHDKQPGEVPSVLAQVLTDRDEIAERWTTSIHTTQCTYRSIAVQDPDADSARAAVAAGRPVRLDEVPRAVYAGVPRRSAREGSSPRGDRCRGRGPYCAVVADPHDHRGRPLRRRSRLVPTGDSGALLVRSSVLIAGLTQYYDQLWDVRDSSRAAGRCPGLARPAER